MAWEWSGDSWSGDSRTHWSGDGCSNSGESCWKSNGDSWSNPDQWSIADSEGWKWAESRDTEARAAWNSRSDSSWWSSSSDNWREQSSSSWNAEETVVSSENWHDHSTSSRRCEGTVVPKDVVVVGDSESSSSTSSSSSSSKRRKDRPPATLCASSKVAPAWVVAIPSYDRVEVLKKKTLALLLRGKVPVERIYVFADPREHALYKKELTNAGLPPTNVVLGAEGICAQRNKIADYFSERNISHITEIDDDIEDVLCLPGPELNHTLPITQGEGDMFKLLDAIWTFTEGNGCKLWGISTTSNALFMKQFKTTVTMGAVKCTGQLTGYVVPAASERLVLTCTVMEDLQRCFLYWKRGWTCCRFNCLAVKTINRAKGGCSSAFTCSTKDAIQECAKVIDGRKSYWQPRALKEYDAAHILHKEFGDLVTIAAAKPTGQRMFFANDGDYVDYYSHGPTLRMKPVKSTGSKHVPIDSLELKAAEELCAVCGIERKGAGDVDVVEADDSVSGNDVFHEGEDNPWVAHEKLSSTLLEKLTVKELKQRIKDLKLPSPKRNEVKEDLIKSLRNHEVVQMQDAMNKFAKEVEKADEARRKVEEELRVTRQEKMAAEAAVEATLEKLTISEKAREDAELRQKQEREEFQQKLDEERKAREDAEKVQGDAELRQKREREEWQEQLRQAESKISKSETEDSKMPPEGAWQWRPSAAPYILEEAQRGTSEASQALASGTTRSRSRSRNRLQEPEAKKEEESAASPETCFYGIGHRSSCQNPVSYWIWMKNKSARPKARHVCHDCGSARIGEGVADKYES